MSITTPSYRPDPQRTGISLAYTNPLLSLIADEVLPRVPVGAYQFSWNRFPLADRFTVPDTIMGRKGEANTVEFGVSKETAMVEDHGLACETPEIDVQEGALTGYNPLDGNVLTLTELLLLRHEKLVADKVFNLNTYPSANRATLSGTDQFSHASSTPFDTIMNALESVVMRPNVLVFSRPGIVALRRHPQITAMVATTGTGNSGTTNSAGPRATIAQLADLFEVQRILVGEAQVNTAGFGETASLARCWGKHMAMLHINPNVVSPLGQAITFGFLAELGSRDALTGFEPKKGKLGCHYQRVAETKKPIICANDVGYFLQNIIA
jgi:hypothetical protein